MKIAILSDIHANLEAFHEVLKDVDRQDVDYTFSLGDNINYGPDPNEVVSLLRERQILSVLGNHELGLINPSHLCWFNRIANQSLAITRELLWTETLVYLHHLPSRLVAHGCLFVHGCPPNSPTIYLFQVSDHDLLQIMSDLEQEICFVGHTHILQIITFKQDEARRMHLTEGIYQLDPGSRYIVNVGSVGQPRDGNNAAKYVIWDTVSHTLDVRFISYDIAKTAEKILRLGFPPVNASRLW